MVPSHPKAAFRQKSLFLLVVLLVGLASRLPQLLSPHLILDGDEAIVGLMAKHITEGKPVTLYFYGQKYGFAYLEALAGAISFKLFGLGALQLKSAMLVFWLGALAFFYLAAAKLTTPFRGFLLALLFALFPAWAVWSLKARGGYLTSFFFASILVYLFTDRRKDFSWPAWLGIGILLGIVFYAQAFWLAGLAPLIAWHYFKYAKKTNLLALLAGLVLVFAFFKLFGTATSNFWQPSVIGGNKHFFEPWQKLPERFFMHLTGHYYLNYFYKPAAVTRIYSIVWIVIFLLFTGLQLFRGWRFLAGRRTARLTDFTLNQAGATRSHQLLLHQFNQAPETEKPALLKALGQLNFLDVLFFRQAFGSANKNLRRIAAQNLYYFGTEPGFLLFLATWFTVGYCLFFNEMYYGFRYLLPLSGFMLLWLGAEFDLLRRLKILPKAFFLVVVPVFLAAGGLSLYNFRNYSLHTYTNLEIPKTGTEDERLNELLGFLKQHNVAHVYSTDQLLEWFIPFYSAETIFPRALPVTDRLPEYPQRVDAALQAGKPVAFIDYYPPEKWYDTLFVHPENAVRVGHWYFVYLNPTRRELEKMGFYKVYGKPADAAYLTERQNETKTRSKAATSN